MTQRTLTARSRNGVSRRSLIQSAAALVGAPLLATTNKVMAQDKLAGSGEVIVQSYGGSYTAGLQQYVHEPFTKATGIKVVDIVADLGDPQVKAMQQAGKMDWDVAYITRPNYPLLQPTGVFVPVDYSLWDAESLQGVPQEARLKDAVVLYSYAYFIAYDARAFPNDGPKNWTDFWDVKKYPGARGLEGLAGRRTLVAAMRAAGIDAKDIYPMTDDKLDRAFAKLNEIKPHVVKWWTAGGESPQLLLNREYAMSLSPDARVHSAIAKGAPIKYTYQDAIQSSALAMILKGGPNTSNAQKYFAFINRAQIAAGYTRGIGYPSPNTNQFKYLPPELVKQLCTHPDNAAKCVLENFDWLTAKRPDGKINGDYVESRWIEWRAKG